MARPAVVVTTPTGGRELRAGRTLILAQRACPAILTVQGAQRCHNKSHPHRFRHTLASEILGKGGKLEVVAAILGDSAATISRYDAKWTPEHQHRQDVLMREFHGTNLAQAEEQAVKC